MQTRIFNADALDVINRLTDAGERFEAIITDPPYCSRIAGRGLKKYYKGETLEKPEYSCENLSPNAFLINTRMWMRAAVKALVEGGYFFCFSDFRQIAFFSSCLEMAGIDYRGLIVWDKKNARPQKGQFTQQTEFVIWGTKGFPMTEKIKSGLIRVSSVPSKNRLHPCQKPVEVIDHLIDILPAGSRILDPFAGSGSTAEAAIRRGFDFTGIELNPYYFKILGERIKCL